MDDRGFCAVLVDVVTLIPHGADENPVMFDLAFHGFHQVAFTIPNIKSDCGFNDFVINNRRPSAFKEQVCQLGHWIHILSQ
jgi:hypothetical protein